jgi:hypothetical protein
MSLGTSSVPPSGQPAERSAAARTRAAGVFVTMVLAAASIGLACLTATPARAAIPATASSTLGQNPPPLLTPVPPPDAVGCYHYERDGWQRVACETAAYVRAHVPHLEYQDGIMTYSINLTGTPPPPPSLVLGSVLVGFGHVGSETDSKVGPGAFSIQNNAWFTGNNGVSDGVQFADVSRPGGPDQVCIQQVDAATQNYSHTKCVPAPIGIPGIYGTADVESFVRAGDHLAVEAYVPWSNESTAWTVVSKDVYGLQGRYTDISGGILGWGNGSEARFTNTELQYLIYASNCAGDNGLVDTHPCPGAPTLFPTAASYADGGTGEYNNLIPVIGSPPAHLPLLDWNNADGADIRFALTTNGKCPAGTAPPDCSPNG